MIKRTLPTVFRTVVAVPVDMSRGFYLFVLVYSLQLYSVVVFSGIYYTGRSDDCTSCGVRDLSIALESCKCRTGKNGRASINVCRTVPGLQRPVIEDLIGRWSRSGACAN